MKKWNPSTTQIITGGFALAILVGTLLLMLPFASADGNATGFLDALFTATTSICVTGLTTVTTAVHWSLFGKVIILLLIQLGGLGVITVVMLAFLALGKRMSMKDRMLIQDTYNMSGLSGTGSVIVRVAMGTFLMEGIGAFCYALVFVPEFGLAEGLWQSVFLAVSAFCNAGIDILGEASLSPYVGHLWINVVTMVLITMGGLGFLVWWDVWDSRKTMHQTWFHRLRLHTKVVLTTTAFLILVGTVLIFIFEHSNPATLGNMSLGEKWLAALFQSVTFRTAGFFTVPQGELAGGTLVMSFVWMLIGGSPAGTAGGIKTTTAAMVLFCVIAVIKGREDSQAFERKIPQENIRSALTVLILGIMAALVGSLILCATEPFALEDILFETVSAIGTVGLTRGITSALSQMGKCVIIALMFMGRIGPITLVMALASRNKGNKKIQFPEERILIG
ncbi:MAG: potassium transporter KtrB [Lachnospiraceae bacterium]|nr:potassium transporter KtrB [Lachnospiraceae bacterium]